MTATFTPHYHSSFTDYFPDYHRYQGMGRNGIIHDWQAPGHFFLMTAIYICNYNVIIIYMMYAISNELPN